MGERTIEAILTEWRDVERKLEATIDDVEWASLSARIGALRREHQAALDARRDEARELREPKP